MLRVMLVDDTQKDVSLLKEALDAAGYQVVAEESSSSGLLERVGEVRPDVIIVDTDSPSRDVLEQLVMVSRDDPRPIVMFTDDANSDTIQAAIKAGVTAYIVAGMQPERLKPILEVAQARFEADRALRDELKDAQCRLAERKIIEKGKGVVMQQKEISEEEAYQFMRKLAMDRNLKLLEEWEALRAAGVRVELVGGITAGIAVPAAIGIPLTRRGACHGVIFVTGHAGADDAGPDWPALARAAQSGMTLVIYMGIARLDAVCAALLSDALDPSTPAAIVQNATLPNQRSIVTVVSQLAAEQKRHDLTSPAIVLIGEVARDALAATLRDTVDARNAFLTGGAETQGRKQGLSRRLCASL